jgi:hypothetical protein
MLPPAAIYLAHLLFWSCFAVRWTEPKLATGERPGHTETPSHVARYPSLFPILHGFALRRGVLLDRKFGLSWFTHRPVPRTGHRRVRAYSDGWISHLLTGGFLIVWSKRVFKSWRLTAELDGGHELCTGGPFGLVRHPIYLAFDLMAAGSAVWLPSASSAVALAAVIMVGDLRARSEEQLLRRAFKERYLEYMRTTRRFVPFVY